MRLIRTAIVAAILSLLAACDGGPSTLTIVTPTEVLDRSIVEDLDRILGPDTSVDLRATADQLSEEEALEAVATGAADLALISNYLPYRDDVATVMPMYLTVLHVGTTGNEETLAEIGVSRGATVFAGPEGSASRAVFDRFARRTGFASGDYRYVGGFETLPDIVIVFAPISADTVAAMQELLGQSAGFRLTSMGQPEDIGAGSIVDTAVLFDPNFHPFVIPAGTYGDLTTKPVLTLAVDKLLVTRPDLPDSVIYDLINELVRLRPALAAKRPGLFQGLAGDFDASRSSYVVHGGAQAYLQRSEPTVYERYSGIAEVLVTAFIALASATVAGVRIFRVRRKNRIDEFYAKALEMRKAASETNDAGALRQLDEDVCALQERAFELLINEKLAADESFRIFVTLTDDILSEIRQN